MEHLTMMWRKHRQRAACWFKLACQAWLLWAVSPFAAAGNPASLSIGNATVQAGGVTASIPIAFVGDGFTASFQLQFTYNESALGIPTITPLNGGACSRSSVGVVSVSRSNAGSLPSGTYCSLVFNVSAGTPVATYPLTRTVLSCFSGQGSTSCTSTNGFVNVTAPPANPPSIAYSPPASTAINYTSAGAASAIVATPSGGIGTGSAATTTVGPCTITGGGPAFPTTTLNQLSFIGSTTTPQTINLPNCVPQASVVTASLACPETRGVSSPVNRAWPLVCPAVPASNADLSVSLTDSPDPVAAGNNLLYNVTASNNGPAPASGVSVVLLLHPSTTFLSASPSSGGSCTGSGTLTCLWPGATASGSQRFVAITVRVASTATGSLNVTATASSTTADPVLANNSASAATAVAATSAQADLALTLVATGLPATLNGAFSVTATILNNGPSEAQTVVGSLDLPAPLRFTSITASVGAICSGPAAGQAGIASCTWNAAQAAQATRTFTVQASAAQTTSMTMTASASSSTLDPVTSNNTALIVAQVSNTRLLPNFSPPNLESGTNGAAANAGSRDPDIARNGLKVVFVSNASNLVPGDGNGRSDVFLRDRVTGTVTRMSSVVESLNPGVAEDFLDPAISAEGNAVVFAGSSGQLYGSFDGTGRRISVNAAGEPGNGISAKPAVVASGNLVFFDSRATNLLAGTDPNGAIGDIFMKNIATQAVTLISTGGNDQPANGHSRDAAASDDGSVVVFSSLATNFFPGIESAGAKGGMPEQVLVMRNAFGRSRFIVSATTDRVPGNGDSIHAKVSPNGLIVVFESLATNLVGGDSNGVSDIFRAELDLAAARVIRIDRVSVSPTGTQSNGASRKPTMSDDGLFIAFETDATNLIPADDNGVTEVVMKSFTTGDITWMANASGTQPNAASAAPALAGNGSSLAFESIANNLAAADTNNQSDIYSSQFLAGGGDEPAFTAFPLPPPTNFPNCPGGYFIAAIDDGPAAGLSPGIFGLDLILTPPGTQRLEGGINFGGLLDGSQVAFAGFNVQNAANEPQSLALTLNGNPASSAAGSLLVRVRLIRQPSAGVNEVVYEAVTQLQNATAFNQSLTINPGFHVLTVAPEGAVSVPGGAADGEVYVSAISQFIGRPGGGFFGGVVVGGYHATPLFGGSSGFAAFCIGSRHAATARVLSAPSYGATGARDLRLRLLDHVRAEVVRVPR